MYIFIFYKSLYIKQYMVYDFRLIYGKD